MFVHFTNTQNIVSIKKDQIETLVKVFLLYTKTSCDEVSINFVDKQEIAKLHEDYFNDPSPTDCISFPMDYKEKNKNLYSILGEVFVCPEVALEYSTSHAVDFAKELSLYVVHGLLHLIGYDDIEDSDRKIMKSKESELISFLEQQQALLSPTLQVHAF
jgi:probable rRNA maturation factor